MFDSPPGTWNELESMVAQAFREMDCDAEIEKDITTVRGTTNIDVVVTDRSHVPPLTYLCECKYWSHSVPKTVVQAFRTVVADSGAHLGLIVSCRGFQSGCYAAAENSNVALLSWADFLNMYGRRWTDAMCDRFLRIDTVLRTYRNHPEKAERFPIGEDQTDEFVFAWTECIRASDSETALLGQLSRARKGEFPFQMIDNDSGIPHNFEWRTFHTKREYFEYVCPRLLACQRRFEKLAGPLREVAEW